jgi:hypothetical protein
MQVRLLPAGLEEAQFKQVLEGWLFTTVNPWVFGPRRTYLVSNAQKPAIAARVRRARHLRLLVIVPIMLLMGAALVMNPNLLMAPSVETAIVFAMFMGIVAAAITACDHLCVRSLLRDVPRSSQKIGLGEMMWNQSKAMSVKALVIFTTIFLLAATANTVQALTGLRGGMVVALGAIVFALFAAGFIVMLIAKLRATHIRQ